MAGGSQVPGSPRRDEGPGDGEPLIARDGTPRAPLPGSSEQAPSRAPTGSALTGWFRRVVMRRPSDGEVEVGGGSAGSNAASSRSGSGDADTSAGPTSGGAGASPAGDTEIGQAGETGDQGAATTAAAAAANGGGSRRSSAREESDGGGKGEGEGEGASKGAEAAAPATCRPAGRPDPVCLICLETLTSEDFRSGRAMSLDCQCRGDLALRHRECALKWSRVKGDTVCELCRHPVRNLPPVPPRPQGGAAGGARGGLHPRRPDGTGDPMQLDPLDPALVLDLAPSAADVVFDCVRITWVAMIVAILFFDMSLGSALWTGLLAGVAYSFLARFLYRQHFQAIQRLAEQQRQAAAEEAAGPGRRDASAAASGRAPSAGGPPLPPLVIPSGASAAPSRNDGRPQQLLIFDVV